MVSCGLHHAENSRKPLKWLTHIQSDVNPNLNVGEHERLLQQRTRFKTFLNPKLRRCLNQPFEDNSVRLGRYTVGTKEWLIVDNNHEEDNSEKASHKKHKDAVDFGIFNTVQICDANADCRAHPDHCPHNRR